MNAAVLNLISSGLFFIGLIFSKLKTLPLAFLSTLLHFVSLVAFLIGYAIWAISGIFYPNYPRRREQWYGFAEYKQQFQLAALLGAIATFICIITPSLIITSAWIYTLSNLFWTISEYHKKENPPPHDHDFSSTKQNIYFRFSLLATSSSLVAALSASIIVTFPVTTIVLSTFATILGTGLTISSFYYLSKTLFENFPPDNINHSYNKLNSGLANSPIANNDEKFNNFELIIKPSIQKYKSQHPFFQLSENKDYENIEESFCEFQLT